MNRRSWLLTAAVGGAAAAAGALGYLWSRPEPAAPVTGPSARPSAPPGMDLWTMRFEQPGGGTLEMAELRGQLTLVNFWATWCPPCIKELPMLDAFAREQKSNGWQVVGLAIDGPTPVREFLARAPVSFPIGLAGLDGIDLGKSLGNATGALPFTVIFDRQGAVVERKLGELSAKDLSDWLTRHGG